jgi:hypothetical protein
MEQKELLAEVTAALEQYRLTLSPGIYLFATEVMLGKMTGRILEDRSDYPAHHLNPSEHRVTFGFYPLGFVPKSLKGAPPSWLAEYPFLQNLEKLAEAPEFFLRQLKLHLDARLQSMKQTGRAHFTRPRSLEKAADFPVEAP